jgi:hypothetical protein
MHIDNAALETAARQFFESYGKRARPILQERAAIAEQQGNRVSARLWRDLDRAIVGFEHSARPSSLETAADVEGQR